jgi:hypothetical protein
MARADLDHRGAALGIGTAAADDGRDAEEWEVLLLEDVG